MDPQKILKAGAAALMLVEGGNLYTAIRLYMLHQKMKKSQTSWITAEDKSIFRKIGRARKSYQLPTQVNLEERTMDSLLPTGSNVIRNAFVKGKAVASPGRAPADGVLYKEMIEHAEPTKDGILTRMGSWFFRSSKSKNTASKAQKTEFTKVHEPEFCIKPNTETSPMLLKVTKVEKVVFPKHCLVSMDEVDQSKRLMERDMVCGIGDIVKKDGQFYLHPPLDNSGFVFCNNNRLTEYVKYLHDTQDINMLGKWAKWLLFGLAVAFIASMGLYWYHNIRKDKKKNQ